MSALEFWLDFRSPYSYLAHSQIETLPARPAFRPMDVLEVMKLVGNTPTTIVCEVKGRYAGHDLRRWTARYGVAFAPNPAMRQFDGRRLLRATLLAGDKGEAGRAVAALFPAMWAGRDDLGSAAAVAAVLARGGLDLDPATLDDPALDARLTAASEAAAAKGVFGAPTFIVGDDLYFGNDRLDFLRERLAGEPA